MPSFGSDALQGRAARASHDDHVQHHVGAVGDLDAAARVRRIDGAHAVRHHVQRTALHAALVELVHLHVRFGRIHPVVVGAGVVLVLRADEGQVFDARHVAGMRIRDVAVGEGLVVQRRKFLARYQFVAETGSLGGRSIAPVDTVRLRCCGDA